jgi:enediyne biosynthesis protein E4
VRHAPSAPKARLTWPQTGIWGLCALVSWIAVPGCRESAVPEAKEGAPGFRLQVAAAASSLAFEDRAAEWGLSATYRNGREARFYAIVESLGGGGAIFDYDRDGRLDLYVPGGGELVEQKAWRGHPGTLLRQSGPATLTTTTLAAGLQHATHYTHGCAVGDADHDGFPDLLVTGYGGLQFWKNQGDGSFVESHAAAGLVDPQWSSSAGWADLNLDGDLDLYVAHYVNWSFENHPHCHPRGPDQRDVCPPREFQGLTDALFLNQGDGSFRDATADAPLQPGGKGLGVIMTDLDGDTDVDVYVANDTTENFLYWNESGPGRLSLREAGLPAGVAMDDRGFPNGSMGVAVADLNADSRPDLWVTNFEEETFALYVNQGDGLFQHRSRETGVTAIGSVYVGFGTCAEDLENDGDTDLIVSNGHVVYYAPTAPEAQEPIVLVNRGDGLFDRQVPGPEGAYCQRPHIGRGLASGDINRDGLVDFLAVHTNQPAALVINTSQPVGESYTVCLVGTRQNRDAIGAAVTFRFSNGTQTQWRYGGGSYLSHSDVRLRGTVPPGQPLQGMTVTWPGGHQQDVMLPDKPWSNGPTLLVLEDGAAVLLPDADL